MPDSIISIHPMNVGAEIRNFSAAATTVEGRAAIFDAWVRYGVLLFRGVGSTEEHLALSRALGELEMHPLEQMRAEESPYFMKVGTEVSPPYMYDETEIKIGTIPWHRDTAYTPSIAKGAMLRIVETPSTGGETFFCDTANAYDDLPQDRKDRLQGLTYRATLRHSPVEQTKPGAIWTSVRPLTVQERQEWGLAGDDRRDRRAPSLPSVVHPAVLVHPESGRPCLFLSPKEFDYFLGLGRAESDALFSELVAHVLQDRYVYRHRWQVDDAVAWDNRRFMHAAAGSPIGDRRRGLRTTLAGDWVVGRLYEEGVDAVSL
jgi:taurine dioxygenase